MNKVTIALSLIVFGQSLQKN